MKMSKIKFREVERKVRECLLTPEEMRTIAPRHGGGIKKCSTIGTPDNIKRQRFTKMIFTTASLGNVTVCAPNERLARAALVERLGALVP